MWLPNLEFCLNQLFKWFHAYEDAICWDTTCLNCSHLLDENYGMYCQIQDLKEENANLRELIDRAIYLGSKESL